MRPSMFTILSMLVIVPQAMAADPVPRPRDWSVDGVKREALVYVPPKAATEATPVVFVFHGHGGDDAVGLPRDGIPHSMARGDRRDHARSADPGSAHRSRREAGRLAEVPRRSGRPRPEILRRRAGRPQGGLQGRSQANLRDRPLERGAVLPISSGPNEARPSRHSPPRPRVQVATSRTSSRSPPSTLPARTTRSSSSPTRSGRWMLSGSSTTARPTASPGPPLGH